MKKIAIVGYGSIGQRHAKNFRAAGVDVALVTKQSADGWDVFSDVASMLASFQPDAVMISNRTSDHLIAMTDLNRAGFKGLVIVEKPVFAKTENSGAFGFKDVRVAYNLRFHRVLQDLHSRLQGQKIVSAHAYVGQHLSTWRPHSDYRKGYSAKTDEGGGVLLDLSHELDYLQWLFGRFTKAVGHGGHFSELEIQTEDTFSLMGVCERAAHVTATMNYTDRNKKRTLTAVTTEHTFEADLIAGSLKVDGKTETYQIEGNHSYETMVEDLVKNAGRGLSTLGEAIDVVRLVDGLKSSNSRSQWVTL